MSTTEKEYDVMKRLEALIRELYGDDNYSIYIDHMDMEIVATIKGGKWKFAYHDKSDLSVTP